MPRSLPVLLFALATLVAALPAQAQLSFATTTHDFGSMKEGAQPAHTFVLTNTGKRPLTLRSVRPSCGCTTPSFTTAPIAPGSAGEIVVAYDSQGRPGPFRKSIRVTAESGGASYEETLYITGDVEKLALEDNAAAQGNVLFDADAFDFGIVEGSRPLTHVFKMEHGGTRPIRITSARSYPEGVRIEYPATPVFAEDLVEIRVTVPGGTADGPFDYAVVLSTDDAEQSAKSLRLTGTAR